MKILVTDFQSLGKTEIEATGLTVVVGPSNRGKSALIRAITGALFNKPGDDFIRHGRPSTTVVLDGLPTVAGTEVVVEWQKGHNLNQFMVNGIEYKKVGLDAPPVIGQAGYRDIFIGDKERQKGEEIRPQVAGQFDPPFLITKLGSFVNDVLSVVSRLGVLLNANGRAARDLKAQRSLLTQRQKDAKAAEEKLTALIPITDLSTRVEALAGKLVEGKAAQALTAKVRTLVIGRAALKVFCDQTLPDYTEMSPDLGEAVVGLRRLATARRLLAPMAGQTLPAEGVYPLDSLGAVARRVETGIGYAVQRLPLLLVTGQTVPATFAGMARLLDAVGVQITVRDGVRANLTQQSSATEAVFRAISALNGMQTAQTEADTALAAALDAIKICPVCDRPMVEATATV